MIRRISAIAVAVASAGTVLAGATTATAEQPTPTGSKAAPALSCTWEVQSHQVTGNCYRDGWKRGLIQFHKSGATESLFVTDKRTDDRHVSAHIVWWQDGQRRHRVVRDSVADGRGNAIDVAAPDGDRVFLYLCLDGVGCSPWRASRA
ncbi:hypothetical protein [Microlunatus speluncae]|uniref:hypothetical protein n=1 Tax=Microlunatus speluncae TaxID=2594267 RepID=UPI00126670BD|nr:hypothetical protein [Microlunatus speluncae]